MKPPQILKELERAATQLGLRVRYEAGNFRGGWCSVEGEDLIVLNKRHPAEVHLAILCEALRDTSIDTLFLRPAVRATLEEVWSRRRTEAADVDVASS